MKIFVFVYIFVTTVILEIVAAKPYDVETILNKIPAKERVQFIKHHVLLGHELSRVDDRTNQKTSTNDSEFPEEFSIALYNFFQNQHSIEDSQVRSLMANVICFPNGECIDIGDVGIHPRR